MPINSPVLNLGNVDVAVSGFVALAPLGTPLPTAFTATLNAAFRQAGYLNDDGLKEVFDESRDGIPLWQNRAQRDIITDAKLYMEGNFAETRSLAVTEFWYGATVTQTAAFGSYKIQTGKTSGRMAGVFMEIFEDGEMRMTTTTDCEVFRNGDREATSTTATIYPFQIAIYDQPMVYDTRLKTVV